MRPLRPGDVITADWLNQLAAEVQRLRLSAGPGLRLSQTPSGTTISAVAAPRHAESAAPLGYPYGEQWNFGITIDGADVTVHRGIFYHGGEVFYFGNSSKTVTVASGGWVVAEYNPVKEKVDIKAEPSGFPGGDDDGKVRRYLYQFVVEENEGGSVAKLVWATMAGGGDLALMGFGR